jgi:predicted metal-binding protein
MTKHALYVCKSCAFSLTQRDYLGERGGKYLFDRVSDLSESWFLKADFAVKDLV